MLHRNGTLRLPRIDVIMANTNSFTLTLDQESLLTLNHGLLLPNKSNKIGRYGKVVPNPRRLAFQEESRAPGLQ